MNTAEYKAMVVKTIDTKVPKDSLRSLARKPSLSVMTHGILGFNVEVGQLLHTLNQYILGFQMKPEWKEASVDNLGRCMYYAVLLARTTKTSLPGGAKRVRLHGMTLTACLLELHDTATHMLYTLRNAVGGNDLNPEEISHLLDHAVDLLWPLCTELAGSTPAAVMVENAQKLASMYPEGYFTVVRKQKGETAETQPEAESEPTNADETVH